jgi:adenylate cyclase
VDDNEQNRDMLSRRLVKRGYSVLTADGGPAALEIVRGGTVDLILLDIEMPGMTGLEVLKTLRGTSTRADLPVIMATARDQGEDIVEALSLGANDYVTKPLDFPVVIARIESQLSLKRAMEEIRRLAGELEIRNRFIQRTFGRYLSEEVVASLLETPEGLALGGEKREVTLLFADLRGFTAMADRFTPEQVVRLLNNYLGTMADIITAHQGTIDEFIGDAILALFGAPVARPDDAERAAACAVAMQIAMEDVNAFNRREGLPEVRMGIAVNTGDVVVGNIGSQTRAKYGVVGTHVNLAGRIEGFTVGGQILVSESTLRKAGGSLTVGERVTFEAKGFHDPVAVYDLRGVGGRYGLALPERGDLLRPLARALPVSVTRIEGKQAQDAPFVGALVKASREAAELQAPVTLPPFANLRLRLESPNGRAEIYAKVTAAAGAEAFALRFTSVDPEAARLIDEALAG